MADGLIANITHKSKPDLYFALRGGANNFGIVTKFYLDTYPQGLMWGGIRVYPISANATINKAFETFNNNANTDTSAALITSFSYHQGNFFSSCVFDYAKPQADPPIFHDFLALANETYVDTTRITTLHNLTDELDASTPPGFR